MTNRRRYVVLVLAAAAIALVVGWVYFSDWGWGKGWPHSGPDFVPLDSMKAGKYTVQFYISYGPDEGELGFAVKGETGSARYFPMSASTHRGVDPVTLDVFLSDDEQEMWVLSSWPGDEKLAYYRVGDDRCMTNYGWVTASDSPAPRDLGGNREFPPMDPSCLKKVLTIVHR